MFIFYKFFFAIRPEILLNFQGGIVKKNCNFTYHASLSVAPFLYYKDEKDEICGLHQNKDPKAPKIMINLLYNHKCENAGLKFR